MSAHYTSEPAPSASASLHTTFGPLHIALFANQTPRSCQNFLQHCQDGYYAGTIFHRVSPDFVVQGGDPSGTGSGGTSIFEDPEFEYDPDARDPNEKVVLRDELHSRLRFNRRGLVGMAKSEDGSYGSQFFITLANTERELNGQCTLFGRIEGDSIFNVLKIAEAERMEGSERPVYPVKVTSCEVGELGPLAGKLKKRQITAAAPAPEKPAPKKKKKAKGGKALLSFGADEGEEEEMPVRPAKPKFNPNLVTEGNVPDEPAQKAPQPQQLKEPTPQPRKRPRSLSPERSPSVERKHRPKSPDPLTQLPLPRPESPARSPEASPPARPSILSRTNAEIESVKASMRRDTAAGPADSDRPKTALEAMIPDSAIRGRRRPPPGSVNGAGRGSATNGVTGFSSSGDHDALRVFNAFKSKLDNADTHHQSQRKHTDQRSQKPEAEDEGEEAQLCDLHFIANCQSCQSWDDGTEAAGRKPAEDEAGWMDHELRFGKDVLGKDLSWKKEHPGDADSLMVIDPREKEKEISGAQQGRKKGFARDRERDRKRERAGDLEWERAR
jgi:peptidyl-prolyl cis-trans isomerase SDCCAG10